MHDLAFTKLHGAGNDFIFFEDPIGTFDLTAEQVKALCDRRFGIGADGVIVVKPPRDAANDGFMHYINADGTLAQMCGNGVRCFAKYLVDRELIRAGADVVNVETRAGLRQVRFEKDAAGKLVTATVNMGKPILDPARVPTTLAATARTPWDDAYVSEAPIASPFGNLRFTCVSMGNPHAVTFVDDVETLDVDAIGSFYESCDAFPEKANIEFAQVAEEGIRMRVYERGCGETLACGTGACATGVAAYLTGRAGAENDLLLRGGTLHIAYAPNGVVMMTGPAVESFCGTVSLPM